MAQLREEDYRAVKIRFNCGCGFKTERIEEAIRHSKEQGHTLSVQGEIKKELHKGVAVGTS